MLCANNGLILKSNFSNNISITITQQQLSRQEHDILSYCTCHIIILPLHNFLNIFSPLLVYVNTWCFICLIENLLCDILNAKFNKTNNDNENLFNLDSVCNVHYATHNHTIPCKKTRT